MSLFQKQKSGPKRQKKEQAENPYTNARIAWSGIARAMAVSQSMWQAVGIISLLICLASIAGIIYIGSQSKYIPYIVEVDTFGQQVAIGPGQRTTKHDKRVIKAILSTWITNIRTVTPDVNLQKKAVLDVYTLLAGNDAATNRANEYYRDENTNPFKRMKAEIVSVEINTILSATTDTWQVDWTEERRSRKGELLEPPYRMRALVTTYLRPPNKQVTEEQIRKNPIGVFISDFNWSRKGDERE